MVKHIKYILSLKWLFLLPVYIYRKFISPVLPSMCIYKPSCSYYMLEAVKKHGIVKGGTMGTLRILRCAPWSQGGIDPVPDNPKGPMKWLM